VFESVDFRIDSYHYHSCFLPVCYSILVVRQESAHIVVRASPPTTLMGLFPTQTA
jgi:hypothetical protein